MHTAALASDCFKILKQLLWARRRRDCCHTIIVPDPHWRRKIVTWGPSGVRVRNPRNAYLASRYSASWPTRRTSKRGVPATMFRAVKSAVIMEWSWLL